MTVRRPAVRWHGGKWKLAPWIISHFPAHRTYVEPFGGGARRRNRDQHPTIPKLLFKVKR